MADNSTSTSGSPVSVVLRVTKISQPGQETYYKLAGIRWSTAFAALCCALDSLRQAAKARDPFTVIFSSHNLLWAVFELTRKSLLIFNTKLGYTGMAFVHALGNISHLTVSVGLFVSFFLYCYIGPDGFHGRNSDMACRTVVGACVSVLVAVVTFHIAVDYRQMVETHLDGVIDQAALGSAHGSTRLKIIVSGIVIMACFGVWLSSKFLRAKLPKNPKMLNALVMAIPAIQVVWLGQHVLSVAISSCEEAADKAEILEWAADVLLVGYTRWAVYQMLKRRETVPNVDVGKLQLQIFEAQPLQNIKTVA